MTIKMGIIEAREEPKQKKEVQSRTWKQWVERDECVL